MPEDMMFVKVVIAFIIFMIFMIFLTFFELQLLPLFRKEEAVSKEEDTPKYRAKKYIEYVNKTGNEIRTINDIRNSDIFIKSQKDGIEEKYRGWTKKELALCLARESLANTLNRRCNNNKKPLICTEGLEIKALKRMHDDLFGNQYGNYGIVGPYEIDNI